jgi:hypothetical protein
VRAFAHTFRDSATTADSASGGFFRQIPHLPVTPAVEQGMLSGKICRSWPKEGKFEIVGKALDGRGIGIVCRITTGGKARIITVYEDKPN